MKPMTEKPTERGDYNILVPGVFSIMPMYASFDGQDWVDGDLEGCFYFDKPEPFGSQNCEHAEPEVDNSLAGRLERYKESK